jgi:hypothetical protein
MRERDLPSRIRAEHPEAPGEDFPIVDRHVQLRLEVVGPPLDGREGDSQNDSDARAVLAPGLLERQERGRHPIHRGMQALFRDGDRPGREQAADERPQDRR